MQVTGMPLDARVTPTLQTMADVYRCSRDGGPESKRFKAYLRVINEHRQDGFQAYNPMAGNVALDTVEQLLGVEAERVAEISAEDVLARCGVGGVWELSVIVATPGMWTHRLVSEAEHRLRAVYPPHSHVQMWAGEPARREDVQQAASAEAIRMAWGQIHGPARTVSAALTREGLALALSDSRQERLGRHERIAVSEALAALGGSRVRVDILSRGYGDPLTEALGWQRVGLPDRAGCRLAADFATQWIAALGPAKALHRPPQELLASIN